MKKKILAVMLSAFMVFAFAACGDNDESQKSQESGTKYSQESGLESGQDSNIKDMDGKTDNDDGLEAFSESLTFMGFNFNYPQGINLMDYTYGYIFYNTDIFLLLEAPAIAAVLLDVTVDSFMDEFAGYVVDIKE